ncbi:hypothetical protein RDABS01_026368 [Bienertia sinuspersici]
MSPNVVIYTTLVDGYCKNGAIAKAKDLFYKVEELELVGNQHTYTVLINGLFKKGLKKEGFQIGHCKDKNPWEAEKLVKQMSNHGLSPNLVTYNSLIDGFCNIGRMSKGLGLFGQMKLDGDGKERYHPSKVTYTILMNTFVRSGNIEKALEMYNSMKKAKLEIDVYTIGAFINGWCGKGRMLDASKLFKSLKMMHLHPSDVIYNMMISSYYKEGSSYKALRFLKGMREHQGGSKYC